MGPYPGASLLACFSVGKIYEMTARDTVQVQYAMWPRMAKVNWPGIGIGAVARSFWLWDAAFALC